MKDMSILLGRVKFESEPNLIWSGTNVVEMPTLNKRQHNHKQQKISDKPQVHVMPYATKQQQSLDGNNQFFRVLLVAGSVSERHAFRNVLQEFTDFSVDLIEAANGAEGLNHAGKQKLDCILIDSLLPDMSGMEFLERVTEVLGGLFIPVLKLLAPDQSRQRAESVQCYMDDYLIKDGDGHYLMYLPTLIRRMLDRQRMERERKQIESMYRALVEHIPVITYIAPLQSDIPLMYVSPQIDKLGYCRDTWLSKPGLRFQSIYEEDRSSVEHAFVRSCKSGEKFRCEYRMRSNSGKLHWFLDEAIAVRDHSEEVLFFQGVMVDISDMKIMESELESHRYFLEQRVSARTEQLEKRIAILESCNAELCNQLEKERMVSKK